MLLVPPPPPLAVRQTRFALVLNDRTEPEGRHSAGCSGRRAHEKQRSHSEPGLRADPFFGSVHEGHSFHPRVALQGQPLMLYRYLLYLNAFLDGVGAAGGAAQRAGGPRGRFRRDRVLVDVATGGSRILPAGLFAAVLLRELLLLLLERGTPREGGVRRWWFLRGSRTVG